MANTIEVEILLQMKEAQASIKGLEEEIKKLSDKGAKSLNKLDIAMANFAANLATKVWDKALAGAEALFDFLVTDGIKAAQEQEEAINKLNIALTSTGKHTDAASLELQKFASAMQSVTTFSDELITENIALLASLTDLSGDGLKDATSAALDLSAALGIDLRSATMMVAKAAEGNVAGLKKFGIEVQKGATDAETFANALEAMNSKFGGAATGAIKTFSGQVAQLKNSINEVQETFGMMIIQNPAVISAINILNKGFIELQKVFEDSKGEFEPLITLLAVTFGQAAQAFFAATGVIVKGLATMSEWVVKNDLAVSFLEKVITNMLPGMQTFMAIINAIKGEETATEIKKVSDQMLTLTDNVNKFPKDALASLFDDLPKSEEGIISPLLPPEQLKQEIALEAAVIAKANQDKLDQQLAFEESLKAIKVQFKTAEDEEAIAQAELEKALMDENRTFEQQFLRKRLDELSLMKLDAQIKEATARGNHLKALQLMEEKAKKEDVIANREHVKTKKEIEEEEIANKERTFSTIAGLQNSSNKTLAAAGKAMAIYEATMNTYRGISMALGGSGLPIPANFIAAALVGAAGAAQVARIAGLSFAEGGIVPGTSYNGDRVNANVNSGEMILNKRQQENLFNGIDNGTMGGGVTINVQGNVMADDESQVQKLVQRINDAMEFNNIKLRTT